LERRGFLKVLGASGIGITAITTEQIGLPATFNIICGELSIVPIIERLFFDFGRKSIDIRRGMVPEQWTCLDLYDAVVNRFDKLDTLDYKYPICSTVIKNKDRRQAHVGYMMMNGWRVTTALRECLVDEHLLERNKTNDEKRAHSS
jgi:hypothetical protein